MDDDSRPDFAKRLEQARIDRGFATPKDAARFFGWTYETYIQHEQGIRGISRASGKYAKAFRVSEAWLLTGEGDLNEPLTAEESLLLKAFGALSPQGRAALLQVARTLEDAQLPQVARIAPFDSADPK